MQPNKFIAERKEYWERLRVITVKLKRGGYRRLSPEEARDFPNLYRKTCTDSETAKTLKLPPDTLEYVNALVLQAHSLLYASPRKTFRRLARIFWPDFPQAFAGNIVAIAVIFFLFFGVAAIAFFAVYLHPENAASMLPSYALDSIKNAYREAPLRSASENIVMAGFYISNNVTIAFASFILGLTFGLLTIYLVFYNALVIGGVLGLVASSGYGANLFSFVIAHSACELLGLCLAGGAGLAVGVALVTAGDEKRSLVLARKARAVVPLFLVAGIFITLAAFIEGFISASPVSLAVKIAIALLSFSGIAFYAPFVFWRRFWQKLAALLKRRHQSGTERRARPGRRVPPRRRRQA
jgi:uncharacterized membrane protein SpoIIM required for sporulation